MFPSVVAIKAAAIRAAILFAIACALFLSGFSYASHLGQLEKAAAQRDTANAYAAEIVRKVGENDALTAENNRLRAAQAPQDRIITREVARYVEVTKPADRCALPGTWRLRHDAAATGLPTGLEAGPLADGSADPVTDAAALATVADNYRACREAIAKLEGWQRRQHAQEQVDEKAH